MKSAATASFTPGTLVELHRRTWVVMPSPAPDLITLRPLGGSELESRTIWLPAANPLDIIKPAIFEPPGAEETGDFASARLLFNAVRLLFRDGAGPFRCAGKISVRPRAFQIVPLVMALRQKTVRLLIADDVGVGKTVEALLIAREMLDRGLIRRIAVLCPPHLCEQWQTEMLDKFGLEAAIIRSGTIGELERQCASNETVFERFDFQVASIDLVKTERYRTLFMRDCPDLVIVDEAHTCTRPAGADSLQQQLRHALLSEVARRPQQHLLLLTATPHSGKTEEFHSLLGLLHPDFERVELTTAPDTHRQKVAEHFIQRRRKNIQHGFGETTRFPERDAREEAYELHPEYRLAFLSLLELVRKMVQNQAANKGMQKLRYYTALTFLRGAMSSPRTGAAMLRRRANARGNAPGETPDIETSLLQNAVLEQNPASEDDSTPVHLAEAIQPDRNELESLQTLAARLEALSGLGKDFKALSLLKLLEKWVREGYNVIVFCRFIDTANYLGEVLGPALRKSFDKKDFSAETITSELPDEDRRAKIRAMESFPRKVLFATDCMSEGINLQEQFNAVVHYDLPWNPNRLEQREGRVDRLGQMSETVRAAMLFGKENPMDGVVLKVLLRKAREIYKATGITVPLSEDSSTVTDAVLNAVLLNAGLRPDTGVQMSLFDNDPTILEQEELVKAAYKRAEEREKAINSIFAQRKINTAEIEADLISTDEAIGAPEHTRDFVTDALPRFGGKVQALPNGHRLFLTNLPSALRNELSAAEEKLDVSFFSPVPTGLKYLGRNHPFVEQLCHSVLHLAFNGVNNARIGRSAAVFTKSVQKPVTLYLMRVRSRMQQKNGNLQQLAEEMLLWGFSGTATEPEVLDTDSARSLMLATEISDNVPENRRARLLEFALKDYETLQPLILDVARQRADHAVEAHDRYRKKISGEAAFSSVSPVLPPDLLGVFILLPDTPTA